MFGELDDSNIYESFDAFSENNDRNNANQEFSFGDAGDVPADGSSDDFLDMSSYNDPSVSQGHGIPVDNGMPDMDVFDEAAIGGAVNMNNGNGQPQYQQAAQKTVAQPAKKGGGLIFVIILILIAAAAGGLFYYKKFMEPASTPEQASGDYFYDQAQQAGGTPAPDAAATNDKTATVDVNLENPAEDNAEQAQASDAQKVAQTEEEKLKAAEEKLENDKTLSNQERAELKKQIDEAKNNKQFGLGASTGAKRVTIPVTAGGRVDPFVPYAEKVAQVTAPKFDLIAPPTEIPVEDPAVMDVVQTKISGIMYDGSRPSAIVNIGGSDYLVHKGDTVNGYQILDITKTSVTIKYNANIYQATVGESVGGNVELNPVSNLSSKFGGAYNKEAKNAINFN